MLRQRWTKVLLFVACLLPLFLVGWRAYHQNLTANPIEYITHFTGDWTIRFLVFTLAVTSTKGWIRRMGGKRWQMLHRLVYGSGIAGVIHYYWLVKSDIRLPAMYGTFVAVLLGYRAIVWALNRRPRATVKPPKRPVSVTS